MKNLKLYEKYVADEKILIKTKTAEGAKEIMNWLNDMGKKIGANATIDPDNDMQIIFNVSWSPGLDSSLTRDLEKFDSYASWEYVEDEKSDPDAEAWDKIMKEFGDEGATADSVFNWLKSNYKPPHKK